MQTGGASPQLFASAPCARNASNPRSEKWLALASVQGNLGISAVAQQMRRLFGRHGGVGRRDVFQAADVDVTSSEDDDFAGWVAYRKAKKKDEKKYRKMVGRNRPKTRADLRWHQ